MDAKIQKINEICKIFLFLFANVRKFSYLCIPKHKITTQIYTTMKNNIFAAALIALGLCLTGVFVYLGLRCFAERDRAVTVKGLSTREVQSDYVVWPLSYGLNGNDLPTLYRDLNDVGQKVKKHMMKLGFEESDLRQGTISVDNNWENYYGDRRPEYKYTLRTSLIVSTNKVDLVVNSQGKESELLKEGIILHSNKWDINYQYNGLPELKPSMIEEATRNARAVAQKFADDAQCSLGSIRRASQGQFSIDNDEYQPWIKHIRVVTTVDYYLE